MPHVPDFAIASSEAPPPDPKRTLQVIGAGYSRTATVSFTLALEKLLKGPVCHTGSASLVREEAFMKRWLTAMSPTSSPATIQQALRDIFHGYVGMTDNPGILFVEELLALYPDAVVICTTRDPETWLRSLGDLLKDVDLWWIDALFSIMPALRFFAAWRRSMAYRRRVIYPEAAALPEEADFTKVYGQGKVIKLIWFFSSFVLTLHTDVLEIHYNYLKRVVPPERLFFYNIKDGWEPLCRILNCPIPEEPLPHANDKAAVRKAFKGLVRKAALRWVQVISTSAVFVGMGVYMWRK
ncbi:hypothetical protein BP5796_01706 [Coleophoma crateriformis]|uniref:NAD dependent epimerase/dehydratase n=1 Tax=Coleophoma crateriformis TaxID=565419 RepID=A0A3D8T161_9HELO|nr:hypothetical protein BP5796_01706 [Coleophoma crateriformis]